MRFRYKKLTYYLLTVVFLLVISDFLYFNILTSYEIQAENDEILLKRLLKFSHTALQDGLLEVKSDVFNHNATIKKMKQELLMLNKDMVKPDDPRLVKIIRDHWIRKPGWGRYHLKDSGMTDFSMGQSPVVNQILEGKERGFFIETGGLDGETRSNSLFFEREKHWEGILIEPGPINYQRLVGKNRQAYTSPACVGIHPYPHMMQFNRGKNMGRLINGEDAYGYLEKHRLSLNLMDVQCFPLYSILLAINRTRIDYLSLDVEGVELDVLRTIPFDKLDIRVMTVEFAHDREGKAALREYVEMKGYDMVTTIMRDNNLANDFVFVKNSNIF